MSDNGRRTPLGPPLRRHNMNTELCHDDMDLEKMLSELSFLRLQLDSVVLPLHSSQVAALLGEKSLYGFTLEYSFPSPPGVSSSLSARVRVPARSFSSHSIVFKHRRVVLIKLRGEESTSLWQRSPLTLSLHAQLNSLGKYSTRLLAQCTLPLHDLCSPPFLISRDFLFEGRFLRATAFVRVDLGSRVKTLMERLAILRGEAHSLDTTFTVPARARSRSLSRRSSARSSPPPSPPRPARSPRRRYSSEEDSVFETPILSSSPPPRLDLHPARSYKVQVCVHSASELPSVQDSSGRWVPPLSFVSLRGRDGEVRSREVRGASPVWDWTAMLRVSAERKNLVVKVLHRDEYGVDKPLCFVSLPLPLASQPFADFELVDLSSNPRSTAPFITSEVEPRGESRGSSRGSSRASRPFSASSFNGRHLEDRGRRRPPMEEEEEILESKTEIADRLRRNMEDLENLMRRLPPH